MFVSYLLAPVRLHLLPFIITKINKFNIFRCSLSWSMSKYFSKGVGSSLDNLNHANSSNFLFFNLCWTAWCSKKNHAAVVFYCHMYFHQYVKYLEVYIIGSKAIHGKQEKIFLFPWPEIKPRTFQCWVSCLAIWAITPLQFLMFYCLV